MASAAANSEKNTSKEVVNNEDLALAIKLTRRNNITLISRSTRNNLRCFEDLDLQGFVSRTDYLINFISIGVNKAPSSIQRPVSILWPDSFEKMADQLALLDAFLINTEFREKPVDWMLKRGLTSVPNCRQCQQKMTLKYEKNTVRWHCQRSQGCLNYFLPIQRPSFFNNYENIALDKLLFSIYYWSTCTPGQDLYSQMNIEPHILDGIWRRVQNVCRTALEKCYPKHRLTNVEQDADTSHPIDLISIKLNDVFVVCGKHPRSNRVRLGLCIPKVSLYNFAELTESWFAHGAHIRVSETKFLDLSSRRTDLQVQLVPRHQMVGKDGAFDRSSAFGYLICQLTHVFKDFDSSTLSRETLKLILAEMEWRELYGTTPYDAFTHIVGHMAQYGEASDWYSEPSLPVRGEESLPAQMPHEDLTNGDAEYVFAEKYFYANVDPVDSRGKIICRFIEPANPEKPLQPIATFCCHLCNNRYESFDFSMHLIAHVEANRKENERKEYLKKRLIECKHCFKPYKREEISIHCGLLRTHLHSVQFGCRICCIRLSDRAEFLNHMRRLHFEHETPYRCPSCKFASSFQRDLFIHFQEEHRHSFIILCPFCLRSFTIAKPETLGVANMIEISKIVYRHISEHYVVAKSYTCTNCCLCFISKEKLRLHKKNHHNPLETRSEKDVKVQPFIVTPEEEKYCVKAIPMELFIPNKRPNLTLNSVKNNATDTNHEEQTTKQSHQKETDSDSQGDQSLSDSDEIQEDGTILVRGLSVAKKFLDGGKPALKISRTPKSNDQHPDDMTSERLIEYFSKMKRADGVIPNQSVILTPTGKPAKCVECLQYITIDHYVAAIVCRKCKYLTHCPRAATAHNVKRHKTPDRSSLTMTQSQDK